MPRAMSTRLSPRKSGFKPYTFAAKYTAGENPVATSPPLAYSAHLKPLESLMRLALMLGGAAGAMLLCASPTRAQELVAVRAGRLVDVERGEVLRDRLILIRGDKIASVEPWPAKPPAGARVVDLSRATVAPGLIDCHTHLVGDVQSEDELVYIKRSAAQDIMLGVQHARATLLAGFTSVRDVGTY